MIDSEKWNGMHEFGLLLGSKILKSHETNTLLFSSSSLNSTSQQQQAHHKQGRIRKGARSFLPVGLVEQVQCYCW